MYCTQICLTTTEMEINNLYKVCIRFMILWVYVLGKNVFKKDRTYHFFAVGRLNILDAFGKDVYLNCAGNTGGMRIPLTYVACQESSQNVIGKVGNFRGAEWIML